MRLLILGLAFLILAAGCGPGDSPPGGEEVVDVHLVPVDTVGIEIGDSRYVFGVIATVDFLPDGRLVVLDSSRQTLKVFSRDGEFLAEYGGPGEAPGELLSTRDMAVLDDGLVVVTNPRASQLDFFDPDTGYVKTLRGFSPRAPFTIDASGDLIVGHQALFDREQGRAGEALTGWGIQTSTPLVVFREEWRSFDPSLMVSRFMDPDPPLLVTGNRVYYAPLDWERHRIEVFHIDGTPMGVWEKPGYSPVLKSGEEIEAELQAFEQRRQQMLSMGRGGMGMASSEYSPSGHHFALTSLGLDGSGRIWARRGGGDVPLFDLYDPLSGRIVGVASGPPSMGSWAFAVTPFGIAAYEEDPLDYPRVVLLEYHESPEQESQ